MYILFDIGGTKTRVAASEDGVTFCEPLIVDSNPDFERGVEDIARACRKLAQGKSITAAGGGVAGPMDRARTMLVNAPNKKNWIGKPLREGLSKALGAPVYLENDTAIVGLGEAHAGAGRGFDLVMYVTVSTGVAGVPIIKGEIPETVFGFEMGHQIIDPDQTLCPDCSPCPTCGKVDLEGMISGASMERRFGRKPYEITDSKIWDELAKWLAYGLHNSIVHWSPEVVVLGGSMIVKDIGIKVPNVQKYLADMMDIFPSIPVLKEAELGAVGGLHGALYYIKQVVGNRTQRT